MWHARVLLFAVSAGVCAVVSVALAQVVHHWKPALRTEAVAGDADDPAIWINPRDPTRSVIVGTDKRDGALYVFSFDGRVVQKIDGLKRPNNVDIESGLLVGGRRVDVAVATEREAQRLRIWAIENGRLREIGHPERTRVFEGQAGDRAQPMGIALYRRPRDGAIFAIVSRKAGPTEGYLWQYRLLADANGMVFLRKVREFGRFSGHGEIEAVTVDDELGYVYYADENHSIRKYYADPDHPEADVELAVFGVTGYEGDREGLAIYPTGSRRGYIVSVDQRLGDSVVYLYPREGTERSPHTHEPALAQIHSSADETDGLEVTAQPIGARFPRGALVMMNSKGRNFLLYRWQYP